MILQISNDYFAGTLTEVNLEDISDWSQVKQWYIKWGCLHYTLDGENWKEYDLSEDFMDSIDSKRPISTTIRDENDEILEETE